MTWLVFGGKYILFGRRFAPCPDADWHFVSSFFVMFSLALALLESLTWIGWFIARNRAVPPELTKPAGSLLIPSGWAGQGLAFGFLALAYVLRPNFCEPFHYATISLRDFVGILSLAYGLLILIQA
jgi:hypothetical protein